MTKLPKIEKCVCGNVAKVRLDFQNSCVSCQGEGVLCCWWGPAHISPETAILAWNRVMKAAKAAELAKRAARRNAQAKAAKKERAK